MHTVALWHQVSLPAIRCSPVSAARRLYLHAAWYKTVSAASGLVLHLMPSTFVPRSPSQGSVLMMSCHHITPMFVPTARRGKPTSPQSVSVYSWQNTSASGRALSSACDFRFAVPPWQAMTNTAPGTPSCVSFSRIVFFRSVALQCLNSELVCVISGFRRHSGLLLSVDW